MNIINKMRERLLILGHGACFLALFAVQVNKPLTNIALVIVLFCSIFAPRVKQRFITAFSHPVVLGCLIWMLIQIASSLHAFALGATEVNIFSSYVLALLYPLFFTTLIETETIRRRVLVGFALCITLMIIASWLQFFGVVPQREGAEGVSTLQYTFFKEYTQQGLAFLAFTALMLAMAKVQTDVKIKTIYYLLSLAALAAVTFLLQSRTTYITLIPLLCYWAWSYLNAKTGRISNLRNTVISGLVLLFGLIILINSNNFQTRLLKSVKNEINTFNKSREPTSTGIRIEIWRQSISIIAAAPIFGHGFRQWGNQFQEQTKDFKNYEIYKEIGHPHQESLLIISEQGFFGFILWLFLLAALLRYVRKLDYPYRDFYTALIIIYVTAGLANCLWADYTHRHTFVLLLACIPLLRMPNQNE